MTAGGKPPVLKLDSCLEVEFENELATVTDRLVRLVTPGRRRGLRPGRGPGAGLPGLTQTRDWQADSVAGILQSR